MGNVFENYPKYEYALAVTQLVLAMLGMGATLNIRDFILLFRFPKAVCVGMTLQVIGAPLLALAASRVFGLSTGIAVGFVLVAAMPGGSLSNIFTFLGRGNVPLSISLTGLATLGSLVTTPVVMRLFASQHLPADFSMPVLRIVLDIAGSLLLPLLVGIWLGTRFPRIRPQFSKWTIRASLVVVSLIVVGSLGSGRLELTAHGLYVPLCIIAYALSFILLGTGICVVLRLAWPDCVAIATEVTIRNVNLALLLKASLFPVVAGVANPIADGVLFVALFYGGTALVVTLPGIFVGQKLDARSRSEGFEK